MKFRACSTENVGATTLGGCADAAVADRPTRVRGQHEMQLPHTPLGVGPPRSRFDSHETSRHHHPGGSDRHSDGHHRDQTV